MGLIGLITRARERRGKDEGKTIGKAREKAIGKVMKGGLTLY